MASSGTIGRLKIDVGEILQQAFARAKIKAQQITSEMLHNARHDLDLTLKSMMASGVQLWCNERFVWPVRAGFAGQVMPEGTADIDSVALRSPSIVALSDLALGGVSIAATVAAGNTATGTIANDTLLLAFPSGIAEGEYDLHLRLSDGSPKLSVSYSTDGVTYTTPVPMGAEADGYFSTFSGQAIVFQLTAPAGTINIAITDASGFTMQVSRCSLVRGGSEVTLTAVGQDHYSLLGDRFRGGTPNQYYVDRSVDVTRLCLWPIPRKSEADSYDLVIWRKRHIQDVGKMTNTLDVPLRWYEAIIWALSWRIAVREPEARMPWMELQAIADKQEMKVRETERVQGPHKFVFNNGSR